MKSTIKRLLSISIVAGCVISCQVSAFAAEEDNEWGIIPDDYVFSVPVPSYTVTVGGEKNNKGYDNTSSASSSASSENCTDVAAENDFPYTLEEFAQLHLEETNKIREENGLSALKTDSTLTEMAQKRIEEYLGGHKRADGSEWYTIFDEYDTTLKPTGENWTGGGGTPETSARGFLQTSHRQNVLSEDAQYIGIGVKWVDTVVGPRIAVLQLYAK